MAVPVVVGDRVLVATDTQGTGTYSLGSAVGGYLSPAGANVADGARVAYVVVDSLTNPTQFEIGEGIYTAGSPATISRPFIIRNNDGNSTIVDWSAGTKFLFLAPSASRFVMYDSDGGITLSTHLTLVSGEAASVAVSTPGDRNTGLFFPGPDRVALATNGSTRLEFNATGAALFNNSHGTIGQFLKTNGSTAAPTWASAVDKTGGTMTGALSVAGAFNVYGNTGTNRVVQWATGATARFQAIVDSTAESGSNAGSDFALRAISDAGVSLGDVFTVTRATRKLDFKVTPSVNGSDVVKQNDFTTNTSTVGSVALPGGLIMKWGTGACTSGTGTVTFASSFPTALLSVQCTLLTSGAAHSAYPPGPSPATYATTGFTVYNGSGQSVSFSWLAIGH